MTKQVDTQKYTEFVDAVTSNESKSSESFSVRLRELYSEGLSVERLLTAAVGMSAESGEFTEIVKKMIFQGKPWDEANRDHLIIELGDVIWYAANACMALDISFEEVVARNVTKLEKRYPGGQFDVYYSEHREEDDL